MFGDTATVYWKDVSNADIDYYELRLDKHPGVEDDNLILRTNGISAVVPLQNRTGKLYLYAHSTLGKYGYPAELNYNKPAPPKPINPKLTAKLGGFGIEVAQIPAGCNGVNIYISGTGEQATTTHVHIVNTTYTHSCDAGIYTVTAAYTDIFGEGARSEQSAVTIKTQIDESLLAAESVSLAKCTSAVQTAINAGAYSKDQIVQLVAAMANMDDSPTAYSSITQLVDALELRVRNREIISKINLSPETITIDGKYIHVTGDTVFDNNVIVNNMIQAGAVTADKMSIGSATGARLALTNNLLSVYDENGTLRVKMGVWNE